MPRSSRLLTRANSAQLAALPNDAAEALLEGARQEARRSMLSARTIGLVALGIAAVSLAFEFIPRDWTGSFHGALRIVAWLTVLVDIAVLCYRRAFNIAVAAAITEAGTDATTRRT